jgi:hypothetical protein
LDYRGDPESEMARPWQRRTRERIIPNHRRILAIVDANRPHMVDHEAGTVEFFRQDLDDLESRHFTDEVVGQQRRCPAEMSQIRIRIRCRELQKKPRRGLQNDCVRSSVSRV